MIRSLQQLAAATAAKRAQLSASSGVSQATMDALVSADYEWLRSTRDSADGLNALHANIARQDREVMAHIAAHAPLASVRGAGGERGGSATVPTSATGLCVVQYDTREASPMMLSNEHRCTAMKNCAYVRHTSHALPPYWAKIAILRAMMSDTPACDVLMWLDSDAGMRFSNVGSILTLWTSDGVAMLATTDPPPFHGKFNAGVFAIKNSDVGKAILTKWLSYYNPKQWTRDAKTGGWSCASTRHEGKWR